MTVVSSKRFHSRRGMACCLLLQVYLLFALMLVQSGVVVGGSSGTYRSNAARSKQDRGQGAMLQPERITAEEYRRMNTPYVPTSLSSDHDLSITENEGDDEEGETGGGADAISRFTTANVHIEPMADVPTLIPTRMPTPPKPTLPPNYDIHPPPCINDESEIAYVNGMISPTMTLYNCLANIGDPYSIPTFYNGTVNGVMIVYNSIQLNNLHAIDAVAGTASMDFYFRLIWRDNRLNMPLLWNKLPKGVRSQGIELTLILTNDSNPFWKPDIRFHDAIELDYLVETIRINSTNDVFWSRHTIATFMQPKFEFKDYPSDKQTINVRFGSYAYNQNLLKMAFAEPALTLNQNYDKTYTFESNPIWTYDNTTTTYNLYLSSSNFLNAIYHLNVIRQGNGIVIRLILPIALLIILGGLTFWAQYENRVDSTITLLLSVSALYIVILSNIPLLGYLTAIDQYVFWMFLLLVIAVILHQFYATLNEKSDQWPLRKFAVRIIECVGRTTVFPIAGYFFVSGIKRLSDMLVIGMFLIIIPISAFIGIREVIGVTNAWESSFNLLLDKINNPETKLNELSKVEIFVVNVRMFRLWNIKPDRIAAEIAKNGEIVNARQNKIELNKVFAMNKLMGRDVQGSAAVSGNHIQQEKSIPMVNIMKKMSSASSVENSNTENPMQSMDDFDGRRPSVASMTGSVSGNVGGTTMPQFKKANASSMNDNFAFQKSILNRDDSDDE